jgi:hypothetical protein
MKLGFAQTWYFVGCLADLAQLELLFSLISSLLVLLLSFSHMFLHYE